MMGGSEWWRVAEHDEVIVANDEVIVMKADV